ncbi:E3 ubiquitin-protein ligase TRIM31-like isoform X2 [Lytechinus variegatus]|nr:E3 ubiquitin-protein ligase TRIM31-like isoform X2 [Lytechinus variegatus]XP_041467052.1 E3 ubiquitin-protein ligase TRIM31-like isoform X2 [Lytechinus variegatus]
MATKPDSVQGLHCPMCLDVIRDATILCCGHSFCRDCLEAYDKQHKDLKHIVCPVCRKSTKLDKDRIAGLTPNFLAKGLEDILKVEDGENIEDACSKVCPVHSDIYQDIYCQACTKFICLSCFIDSHQGHKIKKKEELERELKIRKEAVLQRSKIRKTQLEKHLSEADQQREQLKSHLGSLEMKVMDSFAIKVDILQRNKEELLEKIKGLKVTSDRVFGHCVSQWREVMDRIDQSSKLLISHSKKHLDPNMIEGDNLKCDDLEKALAETAGEETSACAAQLLNDVAALQFSPADDKLLDLGCMDSGQKDNLNGSQNMNVASLVSEESSVPQASSTETLNFLLNPVKEGKGKRKRLRYRKRGKQATRIDPPFPEYVRLSKSMKIVMARGFSSQEGRLFGLAALTKDSVVLGYAMDRKGCDRFTLSGNESPYFGSQVGDVYDVAFLSDGRTIISKHGNEFFLYSSCSSNGVRFTLKQPDGGFVRVCTDIHDNIYAVNINHEICIFRASDANPQKVIPTGGIRPKQISVTKTGIMITTTGDIQPSTVTVFDQEGRAGTSIVATKDFEYVYATVDSQDRVLVATVHSGSDKIVLTRYRLQGLQLVKEVIFAPVTMSCPIYSSMFLSSFFYIVSLSPAMVAVATRHHLYFIELQA